MLVPPEIMCGDGAVTTVDGKIVFPPIVYVPCDRVSPGDEELSVDLRPSNDGQVALHGDLACDWRGGDLW